VKDTRRMELDELIDLIAPEKTIEETFNRANEAINTFALSTARIEDWDGFRGCLVAFLRRVEACVLRLSKPIRTHSDYYWARCAQSLIEIYGLNGEKAAFEMARTGNEGGLYAVLRAVAMHVAEGYARTEISAKVASYWEDLSVAEKLEASSEYLAKYGHLLPSELTEGSAARVRANLPKVLANHPRLVQKLRRVGR